MRLLFPSTLTARQRAALHKVADENGLSHGSSGEGARRRITVGNANAEAIEVEILHSDAVEMTFVTGLIPDECSWSALAGVQRRRPGCGIR